MKLRIVSPSSGALKMFPKRFNYGLDFFKKNGYDIDISKNALKNTSYYSSSENDRINDIYKSIDEEVDVVIAAIGGYNSNQLLDYLDYEKIKNSKTTFVGYSDITSLLLAVHTMTGKIVYHGPTFLSELCEYPVCMDYTWNYFEKAINKEKIEYKEPQYEVTEYIDWALQEKNGYKARKKEENRCSPNSTRQNASSSANRRLPSILNTGMRMEITTLSATLRRRNSLRNMRTSILTHLSQSPMSRRISRKCTDLTHSITSAVWRIRISTV